MKKILIIGYFGHGNPGDDAALYALKTRLAREGLPYEVFAEAGGGALSRALCIKDALMRACAVIFCGGNLLQNRTGNLSLFYYCRIIRISKKLGIPVFFASGGIGEIYGSSSIKYARSTICDIGFFGARTEYDLFTVREAGIDGLLMPDLCFTFERCSLPKVNRFAYIVKDGGSDVTDEIQRISHESECMPIVIPMFFDEDYKEARRVAIKIKAPLAVFDGERSLIEALSACRFTVSERLHGAIFSMLASTHSYLHTAHEKCRAHIDEISRRAHTLGIKPPIEDISELHSLRIEELGAQSSEFGIILDDLKADTEAGLALLMNSLHTLMGL